MIFKSYDIRRSKIPALVQSGFFADIISAFEFGFDPVFNTFEYLMICDIQFGEVRSNSPQLALMKYVHRIKIKHSKNIYVVELFWSGFLA